MEAKNCPERNKMTLGGYYKSLPGKICPKTDFVNTVAARCDVSTQTVRLWIEGLFKPSRKEFYRELS